MIKRPHLPLLLLGAAACGDSDKLDTRPTPDPTPVITLESLALTVDLPVMFEVSQSQAIVVEGVFSDGHREDFAAKVELSVEGDAVTIDRTSGLMIKAVHPGTATLKATFEAQSASTPITVLPAHLVSIAVTGEEAAIGRGQKLQLTATGHYADETTQDLTSLVTWASSDVAVATISATGEVTGLVVGSAELSAQLDTIRGALPLAVECRYPAAPTSFLAYETLPAMSWDGIYQGDGTVRPFSTQEFHCSAEFADKETIVFMVMAGWCVYCPDYVQRVVAIGDQLEAAGAQIIFLEAEDAQAQTCDSAYAHTRVNQMGGLTYGLRIGDGDTKPRPDLIRSSPIINAFPSVYVIRKRDMKMIASQSDSDFYLPLLDIVQHPEWNWSDPENPVESFQSNCAEGQEEPFEPNDVLESATVLSSATTFSGGICTDAPDFYEITTTGAWRVTLQFQNAVGNLDLDIWDKATGQPVVVRGYPAGSFSTTRNSEAYEGTGPAIVRVFGVRAGSAPYTFYLETL